MWADNRILIGGIVMAGSLIACSDNSGIRVTRAGFGASWPFTVDAGTLRCDTDGPRKHVTLDTGNGIQYGLNGSAKTFGFPDSASISKPGIVGNDLQPFIERGLTLCK